MLPIDLSGKRAFVAGVADDKGYGWAICKALAQAGATVCVGTWPPVYNLFKNGIDKNKLDCSMPNGESFAIEKIYPLDASFDGPDDVPSAIKEDKRYKALDSYTISEVAEKINNDFGAGSIDILVHSLANGPEVRNPLLQTSRNGYLAAIGASAYSLVSMVQKFLPLMSKGSSVISLTYLASNKVVPGYGGGMSSAKAALESDTRVLAYETGSEHGIRVNTISAGPLTSRAAKAIGHVGKLVEIYERNSPMRECQTATDVAHAAAFLCSPLAAGITGETLYVDKGYSTIGVPTNEF